MNRILWRKAIAFLSLLFCLSLSALAQEEMKVTGTVIGGDDKQPLPNAAVQVKGGKTVPSNLEGQFSIMAKLGDVLEISFLGYERLSVTVRGENLGILTMKPTSAMTKEILVVGYGTTTQKEKVGSIEKVSSKAFENISMPSFDAGLQGRAAGVQITQQSGVLGGAVKINIRGTNSITGNSNPLVVIDGMILYSGALGNNDLSSRDSPVNASNFNTLSNLDPNDIESVEILKDASATAIYGARASGGVMIITTKSGKSGKTKFSAGYYMGVNSPTRKLNLLSGPEWMQLYNEARVNDGMQPLSGNQSFNVNNVNMTPNTIANTDWQDQMFRNGVVKNATFSASGGTDAMKFSLATSYRTDEGMLRGNNYDRLNVRLNLKNKANDWLEIGTNVNTSYTKNKMVPTSFNGGIGSAQSNALNIFPVYNSDGSFFGSKKSQNFAIYNNPVASLDNTYLMNTFNVLGNVYAELTIVPELKFRSSIQMNLTNQDESFLTAAVNNPVYYKNGDTTLGISNLKERTVFAANWITSSYFSYDKTFGGKHQIKATAGFELNGIDQHDKGWYTLGGAGFTSPYATQLSSSITWPQFASDAQKATSPTGGYNSFFNQRWDSYFMRASYNYDKKYVIEGSARVDGTSNFGPTNRYGLFYSIGAAYNFTDEEVVAEMLPWLNLGKLRASWGRAGDPGTSRFGWDASFANGGGYMGVNGLGLQRLANPNLRWANNYKTDVSLDWGVLNNRVSGTFTYFYQLSTDILVNRPIQTSNGYGTVYLNDPAVKIRNQGFEATINTVNVDMQDIGLRWNSSLNLTFLNSKVLSVNGLGPDAFGDSPGDSRVIEGQPIGISYLAMFAGIDQQTGKEMIYEVDGSGNRTGKIIEANAVSIPANRVARGNPQPKFYGGFTNDFSYKGFDLSVQFTFSYGNTIYDDAAKRQMGGYLNGWNQRREVLDRWQKPGDIASIPRLTLNTGAGNWDNTDRFLFDGSFLRLKNLTLGYSLPREVVSAMKLTSLRIFVGGTNLATFTKYNGYDPEVARYQFSQTDGNVAASAPYLATPQMRTFIGGINIGF